MRTIGAAWVTVILLAVSPVFADGARDGAFGATDARRPGRVAYVDGDYLESNGPSDGSRDRPFTTIQEATALAESLSTITEIQVDGAASPYVGPVVIDRSDIALIGVNWNEPGSQLPRIAQTPEPTGATLKVLRDHSNVLVQGFEVEMGVATTELAYGIAIRVNSGCSDVTLRNLFVTGAHPEAISWTRGILVKGTVRTTIEHCRFADIDHVNGTYWKHVRLIRIENSVDAIVQNCEFTRIGELTDVFSSVHFFQGMEIVGGSGHTVRNNLFHDLVFLPNNNDGEGGDPTTTSGNVNMILAWDTDFLTIVNNTVANVDAIGIQTPFLAKNLHAIRVSNVQNTDIRNNLMAYVAWVPGGADSFLCHYQSCYALPCDPDEAPVVNYSAVTLDWQDDFFPDSMNGIGNLALEPDETIDPVFVDRSGGNYHLAPESRCVDAGDPGIADPDGSVSDLGCYGGPRGALPVGLIRPAAGHETQPLKSALPSR
jgi:hypothetical protein